jgi:demethylmenaquinone methyltransferase/2-methoxy-6-polyprenyl-1,4-benzoquinol methylase
MPSSTSDKPSYVRDLFGRVVGRYDLMNTLMTQGRDKRWRQEAARACQLPPGGSALDMGTGTGKQAQALLQQGAGHVLAVDFTRPMLQRARRRVPDPHVAFLMADGLRLPLPDDSLHATISAFVMRNVADIEAAFAEQRRVVKPSGSVICLEIALPRSGWLAPLFRLYFYRLVPLLGGLISGQPDAYHYLPHSLDHFPSPDVLAAVMTRAGLNDVHYKLLAGGSVSLHVGVKG